MYLTYGLEGFIVLCADLWTNFEKELKADLNIALDVCEVVAKHTLIIGSADNIL